MRVRGANFAVAALMAAGLWAGSAGAGAPPSGAPDYLFRLPDRQWAVGSSLDGQRGQCGDTCEAGYHSGDLVLSVQRGEAELVAVAAVRGCGQVAARRIAPTELNGLSLFDKYTVISRAALGVAKAARTRCGSGVADLIDTQALVAVVPGSGWPY